jgi:hypothetical protein
VKPLPALALAALASSCAVTGRGAAAARGDEAWRQVEFSGVERATRGDAPEDRPTPELFGVALVVATDNAHAAAEYGLSFGSFERDDASDFYAQFHAGVRWYPLESNSALQPYLALGALVIAGEDDDEDDGGYYDDEDDDYLLLFEHGELGAYAGAGLELHGGPLYVGAFARALFGEGVDDFDRHDDAFATELGFVAGLRF